MSAQVRVAASLWSTPRDRVSAEAERLTAAGLQHIHWDHTDGDFARAGGFSAAEARELTARCQVRAEAHLMVWDPVTEVDAWTEFCDRVVVHVEARGWRDAVERIAARGSEPAVAISPGTPVPDGLGETAVLVMSIVPGHAGAVFRPESLETVARLRSGSQRSLGLDGGVTRTIVPEAARAGATWFVSGGDLVASPDPGGWIRAASGGRP